MTHAPLATHDAADQHEAADQLDAGAYHGHPNYVAVWAILVVILGVSLGLGQMGNHGLAVSLILGLACIKALLVAGNFMHLRWEPRLVSLVVIFGLLCAAFFYFGVAPDIVWVTPDVVE